MVKKTDAEMYRFQNDLLRSVREFKTGRQAARSARNGPIVEEVHEYARTRVRRL